MADQMQIRRFCVRWHAIVIAASERDLWALMIRSMSYSRYLRMPIPSRSLVSLALLAACELESTQGSPIDLAGFAAGEALA